MAEPPPRMPQTFRDLVIILTTEGVTRGYGHLVKRPCPSTSIQACDTLTVEKPHLMSPSYIERRPSHNLIYIPWITPSITIARNSSAHARICLRILTVLNS